MCKCEDDQLEDHHFLRSLGFNTPSTSKLTCFQFTSTLRALRIVFHHRSSTSIGERNTENYPPCFLGGAVPLLNSLTTLCRQFLPWSRCGPSWDPAGDPSAGLEAPGTKRRTQGAGLGPQTSRLPVASLTSFARDQLPKPSGVNRKRGRKRR